jgi:hypothetical protein
MAPRMTGRLTALKVERTREGGMYADGGGLYLRVTPGGTKNDGWGLDHSRCMAFRKPGQRRWKHEGCGMRE